MHTLAERLEHLQSARKAAPVQIRTLGRFSVVVDGRAISPKDWGRDKTAQLFQYLVTARSRRSLHKEHIIDRLWADSTGGDRDFKVVLHGINKALEPDRPPRTDPKYILREGVTYHLNNEATWIDADALERYIALGNEALPIDSSIAVKAYRAALDLNQGIYLPNRSFEDWTSEERERLQVLTLGTYITLGELLLSQQPLETIRLTQKVITLDNTWEDAYQLQMKAYLAKGNRPGAIKTYQQCVKILDAEFGLDPLPETQAIYDGIV